MLTMQAMLDKVVRHLLTQDAKSMHQEPGKAPVLMLRTPAGLADAVGCLIPAAAYHPDMEGYVMKGPATWKQWSDNGGLEKLRAGLETGGVYVEDDNVMRLLTDLQAIHDNQEPELWAPRLTAVARTWRLERYFIEEYEGERQHRRRVRARQEAIRRSAQ